MKGKRVRLLNKGNTDHIVFDRSTLIGGTTKNGVSIPSGGVLLQNRVLAGYIQDGGSKKWRIIGCVDPTDHNVKYIHHYNQSGGAHIKHVSQNKDHDHNKEPYVKPKKISLKSAVSLLRDYYREQFN